MNLRILYPLATLFISCLVSFGQNTNFVSTVSPKLKQFLVEQPKAASILSNCLVEAISGREVQLYYFYTDDEFQSRASHYYPAENVVGVVIRENQMPLDEFLSLAFEILNSTSERSFGELCERAASGKISKPDFVLEIQRIEFNTTLRMRNYCRELKISSADESKSYFFGRFRNCPDKFEEFLSYRKKLSPDRDAVIRASYERQYDKLSSANEPKTK